MSLAALVSRSSSVPHPHECHLTDKSFLTTAPHPEHSCEVFLGFTKTTLRPAHAALVLTIRVKVAHPASRIDVLSPAFAAAPLGRYCPVASSCLGVGAFVRFLVCKSSNTMT